MVHCRSGTRVCGGWLGGLCSPVLSPPSFYFQFHFRSAVLQLVKNHRCQKNPNEVRCKPGFSALEQTTVRSPRQLGPRLSYPRAPRRTTRPSQRRAKPSQRRRERRPCRDDDDVKTGGYARARTHRRCHAAHRRSRRCARNTYSERAPLQCRHPALPRPSRVAMVVGQPWGRRLVRPGHAGQTWIDA